LVQVTVSQRELDIGKYSGGGLMPKKQTMMYLPDSWWREQDMWK